jgi:hypothetical protein
MYMYYVTSSVRDQAGANVMFHCKPSMFCHFCVRLVKIAMGTICHKVAYFFTTNLPISSKDQDICTNVSMGLCLFLEN